MAAGIAMILLSQLVAAGQLLIDQSSWNARLQLSPLKIVGCEGLLGMLLTVSACGFRWGGRVGQPTPLFSRSRGKKGGLAAAVTVDDCGV